MLASRACKLRSSSLSLSLLLEFRTMEAGLEASLKCLCFTYSRRVAYRTSSGGRRGSSRHLAHGGSAAAQCDEQGSKAIHGHLHTESAWVGRWDIQRVVGRLFFTGRRAVLIASWDAEAPLSLSSFISIHKNVFVSVKLTLYRRYLATRCIYLIIVKHFGLLLTLL